MLISKLLLTDSSILTACCYPFLMHYPFVFYGSQTKVYENFLSCWQHRTARHKFLYQSRLGYQTTKFLFSFVIAAQHPDIIRKPSQSSSSLDSPIITIEEGWDEENIVPIATTCHCLVFGQVQHQSQMQEIWISCLFFPESGGFRDLTECFCALVSQPCM